MKKFAIPAILAATVMVAGLFAFAPVQQASTVHLSDNFQSVLTQAAGSTTVRTETFLNVNAGSTGFTGDVTYRISGGSGGVFSIDSLYVCDLNTTDDDNSARVTYTVNTSLADSTAGTGNLIGTGNHKQTAIFGGTGATGEGCHQVNLNSKGGEGGNIITLQGDHDNAIIVHMRENIDLPDDEDDGAYLVAYISGLEDADQLVIDNPHLD